MSLTPGARIGMYEIVATLGVGGMGEVFRARDLRLHRDVAMKVMAAPALVDQDARSRFEREAQTLAALNHPNVTQIFGVEHDGDVPVIAMELVDGQTLADRLHAGPLRVPEALTIATQVCDGLDAAHERGIVHRDLKPANIKVRPDGLVKILDFGIALVATARSDATSLTTTAADLTADGVILGTASYMSPEQARGLAVDRRTDIWAFGCLLYEMLTGTRAFGGTSVADVVAAVVHQEPDWSRLPVAVPPRIVELLKRCLAKPVKDRQRDIADARAEIDRAMTGAGDAPRSSSVNTSTRVLRMILPFVAGAALAALAAALLMRQTPATESGAIARATITLPADTTLALSRGAALTLSPNGRRLVFAGRSKEVTQLYRRDLDRFESTPMAGTEEAANPFFSPDGKWVGFFAKNKLLKVSLDGGAPIPLLDAPLPRGHAWASNDTIYFTPANNRGISQVPATGGTATGVTTLGEGEMSHRWPSALPGASALLFTIWNDSGWAPARIVAERLGTGERSPVVPSGGGYGRYVRDGDSRHGYLVFARAEGLLAAPFDETRLAVTGPAVPVVEGVITNLSGGAHFDLSASGTLAYAAGSVGEDVRTLKWVGLDGTAEHALTIAMGRFWDLSPDGTRLVRSNTAGPTRDVWIDDLDRKTSMHLSKQDGNFTAVWSADGAAVFLCRGIPIANLYRHAADGSGRSERLTTSTNTQVPTSVSSDGEWLLFSEIDPVSGVDVWALPLKSRAAAPSARPFVRTRFVETEATFSPDGQWVAYQSNESGQFEVYVRPFPSGDRAYQVSTGGGISPVWAPSTRELYLRSAGGKLLAVPISTAGGFSAGAPRELFNAAPYENYYGLSRDGEQFLMMALTASESSATQIQLIFNFLEELRLRVR